MKESPCLIGPGGVAPKSRYRVVASVASVASVAIEWFETSDLIEFSGIGCNHETVRTNGWRRSWHLPDNDNDIHQKKSRNKH